MANGQDGVITQLVGGKVPYLVESPAFAGFGTVNEPFPLHIGCVSKQNWL